MCESTRGFESLSLRQSNAERQSAFRFCFAEIGGKYTPFTYRKMLYAKYATKEGYSVWMLAHSSLNESFNRNRRWYNIFVYPDIIREIWFNPSDISMSQEDYSYRVCFAKNKEGLYVFQGIYEPQKIEWEEVMGKRELVRTFKRISKVYPISEESLETEKEVSASDIFINLKRKEPA
ncbi:MAG: hypothetical protein IJ038_04455 [Clostridia bacterium]|nr:hypothetical protein [Clostridia bacterium]